MTEKFLSDHNKKLTLEDKIAYAKIFTDDEIEKISHWMYERT